MLATQICYITKRVLSENTRLLYVIQNQARLHCQVNGPDVNLWHRVQRSHNLLVFKSLRHYRKKTSTHKSDIDNDRDDESDESDDSDTEEPEDYLQTKAARTVIISMESARVDAVLKAGLNISRNKIDKEFLVGHIRVNQKKLLKKGAQVREGDEVDMLVGRGTKNPDYIVVHRVTVLSMKPIEGVIRVKLLRNKSLLIEDYPEAWETK